jgi:hypothetical protein
VYQACISTQALGFPTHQHDQLRARLASKAIRTGRCVVGVRHASVTARDKVVHRHSALWQAKLPLQPFGGVAQSGGNAANDLAGS